MGTPRGWATRARSLGQGMVIEAEDTGDFPGSVLVLPEMNEPGFADRLGILVSGMKETVNADLHGAVVGNGVYLKGPGNEFSRHFATDVAFDAVHESLPSAAQAGDIVIELQIVGQQGCEFLQIAMVVGIEELGVQRLDGLKKVGGCRRSLWVDEDKRRGKENCKKDRSQRSYGLAHAGSLSVSCMHLVVRAQRIDGSGFPSHPSKTAKGGAARFSFHLSKGARVGHPTQSAVQERFAGRRRTVCTRARAAQIRRKSAASGKQISRPSMPMNPTMLEGPHGPQEELEINARTQVPIRADRMSLDTVEF
jgi:hypothetical protein